VPASRSTSTSAAGTAVSFQAAILAKRPDGTGETFEEAKAEFEEAWNQLRPTRTEAHYELWRQNRDFTAWKYRMHDEHLKLPTQTKNDRCRCFCGAEISNRSIDAHIQQAHRIGA
jgi:hypothetical protein